MRQIKFRAWDKTHKEYFNVIALGLLSNEVCGTDRTRIIGEQCYLEQFSGVYAVWFLIMVLKIYLSVKSKSSATSIQER
jgi:hypothetical protein